MNPVIENVTKSIEPIRRYLSAMASAANNADDLKDPAMRRKFVADLRALSLEFIAATDATEKLAAAVEAVGGAN